jgi:antitoxin YefM
MEHKGRFMQVVNFTEARNNLKSLFDMVYANSEEVVVNRKNGENVVIMSLESYNALQETAYLFASPKNKERLLSSLSKARSGKLTQRELVE